MWILSFLKGTSHHSSSEDPRMHSNPLIIYSKYLNYLGSNIGEWHKKIFLVQFFLRNKILSVNEACLAIYQAIYSLLSYSWSNHQSKSNKLSVPISFISTCFIKGTEWIKTPYIFGRFGRFVYGSQFVLYAV